MSTPAKQKTRLLLVDDDLDMLEALAEGLGEQGFEVTTSRSAEAAIVHVAELLDACQLCGLANVGIRTYDEDYNRGR